MEPFPQVFTLFGEDELPERQLRVLQCLSCLRNSETGLIDADLRNVNLCADVTSLQRYRIICELRTKGMLDSLLPDDPDYPEDLQVKDHRRIDRITEYGEEKLDPSKVCGFSRDKFPKAFNPYKDAYGGTHESRREVLDCIRCLGAQALGVTNARIARCNGMNADAVRGQLERMVATDELAVLPDKEVDMAVKILKTRKVYAPTAKTADILVNNEMPGCSEYIDELQAVLAHRSSTELAILDALNEYLAGEPVGQREFTLAPLAGSAPETSRYNFVHRLLRAAYIRELPREKVNERRTFELTESGALLLALRAEQTADPHN